MSDETELRGVGGWLGFFVVVIAILSPLRLLISAYINLYADPQVALAYGPLWPRIQAAEWAIIGAALLVHAFIAWRLLKVHRWSSVRITIVLIWLLATGVTWIELVAVSMIAQLPLAALAEGIVVELARPFIFCLVWTAYLLRSKRVANTYPRHAEAEEVAEVFG